MSWPNYAREPGKAPARRTLPSLVPGPHPPSRDAARQAVARVEAPPPAEARIVKAQWSTKKVLAGEEVTLACDLEGPPPPKVRFAIFEHDADGQHDFVRSLEGTPKGARCEVRWAVEAVDDQDDAGSEEEVAVKGYTLPEYYFVATDRRSSKDSGQEAGQLLKVTDVIDQVFHDPWSGAPLAGTRYVVTLADGRRIEGELDAEGRVHLENVPPRPFWFRLVGGDHEPFEPAPGAALGLGEGDEAPAIASGAPAAAEPASRAILDSFALPPEADEGAEVRLAAHVRGFPDGTPATFRLYKLGPKLDSDAVAAEVEGAVEGGLASARWVVAGAEGSGERDGRTFADFDLEVEIDGVRFRTLDIPELRGLARPKPPADEANALRLLLDVDATLGESADDTVTLTGDDGYEKTLRVKGDGKPCGRMTDLVFEGVKPGARYSCKVDPGKEGAPYYVFRDRLHEAPAAAAAPAPAAPGRRPGPEGA